MPQLSPREAGALLAALVPWTWFLVRDLDGRLDAVAYLWPLLGLGVVGLLLAVALFARWALLGLSAVSWLLATLVVVVAPWGPHASGPTDVQLRIVAANTLADQSDAQVIAADILDREPDLVVVSEVSDDLDAVLARRFAGRARIEDVAVYSSQPVRLLGPAPADQRGLRADVTTPDGRHLVLYALHLQKPGLRPSEVEVGFRTHKRLVDAIVDQIRTEDAPVVVAGDLNLADRTSGYRHLAGTLDDAMRAGWSGPTSVKRSTRLLLARIDHIFMPDGWCAERSRVFVLHGSDHRGVVSSIGPCRED